MDNLFLKTLREDDRTRLLPLLSHCEFAANQVLVEAGDHPSIVAFPRDVQFSQQFSVADDAPVETALIGREGMTAPVLVQGDAPSPWRIAVRVPGSAWCVPVKVLSSVLADSPELRRRLNHLAAFYGAQNSLSSACIAHHQISGRVATWLLHTADLDDSSQLRVTQEHLSHLLATQRTSIVEAFSKFREVGATQTRRGTIVIHDRRALEAMACPCRPGLRKLAEQLDVPYPGPRPSSP